MRQKQHTQLELDKVDVLTDLLSSVSQPAHKDFLDQNVELIEETVEMDNIADQQSLLINNIYSTINFWRKVLHL